MSSLDSQTLRQVLGRFATGVAVITTSGQDGEPIGVTANSFTSVSLNPPLVLFNLDKKAYSYPAFRANSHFAVNVLGQEQSGLSTRFAQASTDKWLDVEYELGSVGCPILRHHLAVLECRTETTHDAGDHAIFIGRVLGCNADFGGRPLLFFGGNYGVLAEISCNELDTGK